MEENKITSRELIKNYLPEPKEFDKLSKFKNLIKANIDLFPSETKLSYIYNSYAKVHGFKDWNEFKKTLIDDSAEVRNFKSAIRQQNINNRHKELNWI